MSPNETKKEIQGITENRGTGNIPGTMESAGFTKEQLFAISHKEGPMLVLAGPGSGKTTVITNRVRFLVEKCGVSPSNILVITFTRAAADEMKERYLRMQKGERGLLNFGTFHAVFYKILCLFYHYDASNILSEDERFKIVRELVTEKLQQDFSDEKEMVQAVLSEISNVKNEQLSLEHFYSSCCPDEAFRSIYEGYQEALRRNGKLDFDDMLSECYRLLHSRPDILRLWQEKYQYILIDEFQDINRIQYETIKLLAAPENNLFIVGDDDQSIYQFRGARPELMQRFTEDFKETEKITLSCNFRSTAQIVTSSARLIQNNTKRFEKKLYAKEEQGDEIALRKYPDRRKESFAIAEELAQLHRAGIPYREMAVLYRTNLQTRTMISQLISFNIPFRLRDFMPNLYDHFICRDMIAYLKMAAGNRERGVFLSIMNRPKRYLSREALFEKTIDFEQLIAYYEEKDYVIDKIEKLTYDLSVLSKLTPLAAINYIRRAIDYDSFLSEYARYRKIDPEELFDIFTELMDDAAEYQTTEAWFAHMDEVTATLTEKKRKERGKEEEAVTLSTYHYAKGLEFHTVFLPELCEGLTPYKKAIKEENLEEERRMFYVAMTRAKRRLVLSYLTELRQRELLPSRFIGEVFLDRESLRASARVEHKVYGPGTVLKNEGGRLTIRFDHFPGDKLLNEAYCIQSGLLKSPE